MFGNSAGRKRNRLYLVKWSIPISDPSASIHGVQSTWSCVRPTRQNLLFLKWEAIAGLLSVPRRPRHSMRESYLRLILALLLLCLVFAATWYFYTSTEAISAEHMCAKEEPSPQREPQVSHPQTPSKHGYRISHFLRLMGYHPPGASTPSTIFANGRHPKFDTIIDVGAFDCTDYTIPGKHLNLLSFTLHVLFFSSSSTHPLCEKVTRQDILCTALN